MSGKTNKKFSPLEVAFYDVLKAFKDTDAHWFCVNKAEDGIDSLVSLLKFNNIEEFQRFLCMVNLGKGGAGSQDTNNKKGTKFRFMRDEFEKRFTSKTNHNVYNLSSLTTQQALYVSVGDDEEESPTGGQQRKKKRKKMKKGLATFLRVGQRNIPGMCTANKRKTVQQRWEEDGAVTAPYMDGYEDIVSDFQVHFRRALGEAEFSMSRRMVDPGVVTATAPAAQRELMFVPEHEEAGAEEGAVLVGGEEDQQEEAEEGGGDGANDDDDPLNNLILLRLKAILPLVMEENSEGDTMAVLKKKVNVKSVEEQVRALFSDIMQHKESHRASVLGTQRYNISPNTLNDPKRYAKLKELAIVLQDCQCHEALLRELYSLMSQYAPHSRHEFPSMSFKNQTRGKSSFVRVPASANEDILRRNANKHGWFDQVLSLLANGSDDQIEKEKRLIDLLLYIARTEEYQSAWIAAVMARNVQVPLRIDPATTKAIQFICNMSQTQMRLLRRCLNQQVRSPIFASEYAISKVFQLEHIIPSFGTHREGSERIPWSYRRLPAVIRHWLQNAVDEGRLPADDRVRGYLKCVDVVINLDHGKGHLRSSVNLIARGWRLDRPVDEDDERLDTLFCEAICLGNAQCQKDSTSIISKTFGKLLNADVRRMKTEINNCFKLMRKGARVVGVAGDYNEDDDEDDADDNENDEVVMEIPIEVYLSSDIMLYSQVLGKAGSAPHWCPFCKLGRKQWQKKGHRPGEKWDVAGYQAHFDHLKQIAPEDIRSIKSEQRMGVVDEMIFDAIPIENYIIPKLHILIGKTNDILRHLCSEAQAYAESYSQEYVEAEVKVAKTKTKLGRAQRRLQAFKNSNSDYIPHLRYLCRKQKESESNFNPDERADLLTELEDLEALDARLRANVNTSKGDLTRQEKLFHTEKSKPENSKERGQPVLAAIDKILLDHGIRRSNLFGGTLNGNGCRRFMASADSILDAVESHCNQQPSRLHQHALDFRLRIIGIKMYLRALDGLISAMSVRHFRGDEPAYQRTKLYVERFLELERFLGISITPKSHLLEDHLLEQQRRLCGIGDLDEEFGERMHQTQSRADIVHSGRTDFFCKEIQKFMRGDIYALSQIQLIAQELRNKMSTKVSRKRPRESEVQAAEKKAKRATARQLSLDYEIPSVTPLTSMAVFRFELLVRLPGTSEDDEEDNSESEDEDSEYDDLSSAMLESDDDDDSLS